MTAELDKKLEYYCLIHRNDGAPLRNALANSTSAQSDVIHGSYFDCIRDKILNLAEKTGFKSFRDRQDLIKYFQKYFGTDVQISIYDALSGKVTIHGDSGEQDISGTSIAKPEFAQIPRSSFSAHINSDKLTINQVRSTPGAETQIFSSNYSNAKILASIGIFGKNPAQRSLFATGVFSGAAQAKPKTLNSGLNTTNEDSTDSSNSSNGSDRKSFGT